MEETLDIFPGFGSGRLDAKKGGWFGSSTRQS